MDWRIMRMRYMCRCRHKYFVQGSQGCKDAKELGMTENEISKVVFDLCVFIHKKYGPGLFESVYEEIICY